MRFIYGKPGNLQCPYCCDDFYRLAYRFVRKQIVLFYREGHRPVRLGAVPVKFHMRESVDYIDVFEEQQLSMVAERKVRF